MYQCILILFVNLYLLFYCKYNCVFVYVWELHIFMELSPSLFKKDKILGLISILVHHRHSCDGCASSVGSCKVRCRCRRGTKRNILFLNNGNSSKKGRTRKSGRGWKQKKTNVKINERTFFFILFLYMYS